MILMGLLSNWGSLLYSVWYTDWVDDKDNNGSQTALRCFHSAISVALLLYDVLEGTAFLIYRIFYLLAVEHPSASGGGFLTHAPSFAANLCQRSVQVDEIMIPLVV